MVGVCIRFYRNIRDNWSNFTENEKEQYNIESISAFITS